MFGHFVPCGRQYSIQTIRKGFLGPPGDPKIKKRLKTGWKTTTFYLPNGFGCHFQRLTQIELKFHMEQHNTCNIFSCFIAPPLKMLKKIHFFSDELYQKNIYEKTKIQFDMNKVYFLSLFRGGAIKHEKMLQVLCCSM